MSRRRPSPGPPSSRPIRPILAAARGEAELARHGYIGLEHLLITLTQAEASATAPLLAEHGITTQPTRDAVWLVVGSGRGDGPPFDPATTERSYRTVLAGPVATPDQVIGLLTLDALAPGELAQVDVTLVRLLADLLATALSI